MSQSLLPHLASLPRDLAKAVDATYRATMDHFLKDEWDDAQIDAGRFCEAALRILEFDMTDKYTVIDGKSKPNRKHVVNAARNDTNLAPSMRAQIPQAIELVMDFRNNRNSAHLGNIDANKMDATCVVHNVTWMVGEIIRIKTSADPSDVQRLLDQLADRHVPLVQTVGDQEIVLDPNMTPGNKVLVLLYRRGEPVALPILRGWTRYGNATRFRDKIVKDLEKLMLVHVDKAGMVTLLRPGEAEAQRLLLNAA